MIKKFLLVLILFSTSSLSFANDRRDQLLDIINDELREVTRLNKQINARDPNLLLRMAELLLEKARIIKETENEKYLSLSPQKRKKVRKSSYFKQSNNYFKQAERTCRKILKRYPRYNGKSDAYYILAFNAKETGKVKTAIKYFRNAIKLSKKGSKTNVKSQLALAEIYFNQANYKNAVRYYERSLSSHKDKWWTKDSFNLAWSYFRLGKRKKAISKMNEVYKMSKDSRYVDMTAQVERDLAYFYTEAGNAAKAVTFYKKRGKDVSKNLLKVGKYLTEQGKFTAAQKTYKEALKNEDDEDKKAIIHLELLHLYERFGRYNDLLSSSKVLAKYHKDEGLSKDQLEVVLYHVKRAAALLQKQVVRKTYRNQKKIQRKKANLAVEFFSIQAELETKEKYKTILAGR